MIAIRTTAPGAFTNIPTNIGDVQIKEQRAQNCADLFFSYIYKIGLINFFWFCITYGFSL